MRSPTVGQLRLDERQRRLVLVAGARRRLDRARGRVWINGRELGGPNPRYVHLSRSYD